MIHFNLLRAIALIAFAVIVSPLTALAQNFLPAPAVSPIPNGNIYDGDKPIYHPGQIDQLTVQWIGTELQLTADAKIAIEDWISWQEQELTSDKYYADGDKLYINVNFDLSTFYTVKIYNNTVKDIKSGRVNAYVENVSYDITNLSITKGNILSNPLPGKEYENLGPEITITVPGWTINPTTGNLVDYLRFGYTNGELPEFNEIDNSSIKSAVISNNSLVITLDQVFTKVGWYGLGLDSGLFTCSNDSHQNVPIISPIMLYYDVTGYHSIPSNLSIVKSGLDSFTIYANNIEYKGNLQNITVIWDNTVTQSDEEIKPSSFEKVSDSNGQGVKFSFDTPFEAANGNLRISIPAGSFTINGMNFSQSINLEYFIRGEAPQMNVIPSNGASVKGLKEVVLFWGENHIPLTLGTGQVILSSENGDLVNITPFVRLENVVDETSEMEMPPVLSSDFLIDLSSSPIVTPGEYTISIPKNFINLSAYHVSNDDIKLTYMVETSSLTEYEIKIIKDNPGFINGLEITWNAISQEADTYLNKLINYPKISIISDEEIYEGEILVSIDGKVLSLTLSQPVEENGTLKVIIPEGFIGCIEDGEGFYTSEVSFTLENGELVTDKDNNDSVNLIKSDIIGNSGIFNLQGIKVKDSSNKGIYLINGKKVVIK